MSESLYGFPIFELNVASQELSTVDLCVRLSISVTFYDRPQMFNKLFLTILKSGIEPPTTLADNSALVKFKISQIYF